MNRKLLVASLMFILSAILAVLVFKTFWEQDDDGVFIKVAMWRSSAPEYVAVPYVHYVIIKDDGTLTSYFGISRKHSDITRRNFMRSVHEQETLVLNEEDFKNISELVSKIIAIENDPRQWTVSFLTGTMSTLYHNGNIYGQSTARSGYFQELINKITQLSP